QTLGIPGSVIFSKKVNDELKNKSIFHTVSLGDFNFKNVNEPIEVFALSNRGFPVPKRNEIEGRFKKKSTVVPALIAGSIVLLIAATTLFYKKFDPYTKKSSHEKTIAVLPFINMSNDKDNEYFTDGISSEITNQLSKINSLEVRAWSSSVQFKNSSKSLNEKAEILNVTSILSGSIQKAGNRIHIQAELTNVDNNKRIWGEEYDREWGDIFTIQSELAQQIALELNAGLTKDEKKQLELKPTDHPQAYAYYLQGIQLHERFRQTFGQEFFDNSKLKFEKAIEIDSNYALAHAGLANLYNSYTDFTKRDSMVMQLRMMEIEKAYSLAPDLDFVNSIRGAIFRVNGNLEESYKSFRKAYMINPNNASTLFEFGLLYSDLGLVDQRIDLLKKAVQLDPLNASYFGFLGGAEVHINRLDEGLRNLQTAYRLEPTMFYVVDRIAYVYALQNNLTTSETWLKKFLTLLPPDKAISFYEGYGQYAAYCFAKLGNKNKALEISASSPRVFLALGMKEEALKIFMDDEASSQPSSSDYLFIQTHLNHKDFDIIRNDPRFLQLMEKKRLQYELVKNRFYQVSDG
ncbi:MAG: hypothetical protein ABJA57_11685, partial [Ginsengibacter sp.]